jgi:hypothetical protein
LKKDLTVTELIGPLKDGLPWQGYAIVPDKEDPEGWQLPHHTKEVKRAAQAGGKAAGPDRIGSSGYEHTVDWMMVEKCVTLLSRYGFEGQRVCAEPEQIIQAARHLAGHYRKAGQQIPTALCVLI